VTGIVVAPVTFADRPDEGLKLILTYAQSIKDGAAKGYMGEQALRVKAASLAEHVLALDAWMRDGGDPPLAWDPGSAHTAPQRLAGHPGTDWQAFAHDWVEWHEGRMTRAAFLAKHTSDDEAGRVLGDLMAQSGRQVMEQ